MHELLDGDVIGQPSRIDSKTSSATVESDRKRTQFRRETHCKRLHAFSVTSAGFDCQLPGAGPVELWSSNRARPASRHRARELFQDIAAHFLRIGVLRSNEQERRGLGVFLSSIASLQ
jgi:hypothetical protein